MTTKYRYAEALLKVAQRNAQTYKTKWSKGRYLFNLLISSILSALGK